MADVLGEDVVHRRLVELDELAARQRALMAELGQRSERVAGEERPLSSPRRLLEARLVDRETALRERERDANELDRRAAALDDRAIELEALERTLDEKTHAVARAAAEVEEREALVRDAERRAALLPPREAKVGRREDDLLLAE